jgi:hypothetical protein
MMRTSGLLLKPDKPRVSGYNWKNVWSREARRECHNRVFGRVAAQNGGASFCVSHSLAYARLSLSRTEWSVEYQTSSGIVPTFTTTWQQAWQKALAGIAFED